MPFAAGHDSGGDGFVDYASLPTRARSAPTFDRSAIRPCRAVLGPSPPLGFSDAGPPFDRLWPGRHAPVKPAARPTRFNRALTRLPVALPPSVASNAGSMRWSHLVGQVGGKLRVYSEWRCVANPWCGERSFQSCAAAGRCAWAIVLAGRLMESMPIARSPTWACAPFSPRPRLTRNCLRYARRASARSSIIGASEPWVQSLVSITPLDANRANLVNRASPVARRSP